MIVVLFSSRLVDAPEGYAEMADEMESLARTVPGFVDIKSYAAEDGERLTISRWKDDAAVKQWREHARHRIAQRAGRERWYRYFKLEVAQLVRETSFERESATSGSA